MFPFFPYSNFHRLNADWILKRVQELATTVETAAASIATWADRITQAQTDAAAAVSTANSAAATANSAAATALDAITAAQSASANAITALDNAAAAQSAAANTVKYTEQQLTASQAQTARGNIGAASEEDLTSAQRYINHAVRWDAQTLTEAQKTQARDNIGAAQAGTVPAGVVRYDAAQTLTVAQKAQARANIGASSGGASDDYVFTVSENEQGTGYDVTGNLSDAAQATGRVFIILERNGQTREALADLSYTDATLNAVSASFADFFAVNSTIPNSMFNVAITSSGATVTEIQQRQVPQPAPLGADRGKVLVAGSSTCTWERITPIENTVSGTTPTVAPADNNIYNCGELSSLTISNPPATGAYSITFTSGATATVATGFNEILGLESFTPAANTIYEINVLNNRAAIGSWVVNR